MEALVYFIFWGLLIFLMMRFGCGAHVMGHHRGHGKSGHEGPPETAGELRWVPPEKDMDPVCKKTVSTGQAKPSVYAGRVYYFCSRECREVFEAAPHLYLPESERPKLEHSHA